MLNSLARVFVERGDSELPNRELHGQNMYSSSKKKKKYIYIYMHLEREMEYTGLYTFLFNWPNHDRFGAEFDSITVTFKAQSTTWKSTLRSI